MSVDKDFVLSALLQHNFFPVQSRDKDEMPPVFSSLLFTPEIARKLVRGNKRSSKDYPGYDAIDYRRTKFSGVYRNLSIPHPFAYADLSLCIHDNWHQLEYIATNKNSMIRPRRNRDGRLIIMYYKETANKPINEKTEWHLRSAFGKRFMVNTDISSFFPTIYSHAIPWAIKGLKYAKGHRATTEWFNKFDAKLTSLKRNETQGVAVGPGTSNIACEVILARVDENLRDEGFVFIRAIDDYTAYCKTEDDTQRFIRRLAEELAKFKLTLHLNKTKIMPLPQTVNEDWITELGIKLPKGDSLREKDALNYLDMAVRIAKMSPDGSVLKYAIKSLNGCKLVPKAKSSLLAYVLTLSFHQTALLPLLAGLFKRSMLLSSGEFKYANPLRSLLSENIINRRSDGMAWTLYYMDKYKVSIDNKTADDIIETEDCIALLLLYRLGDAACKSKILDFAKGLDRNDLYKLDQYWLLLYQLYHSGKIGNPYKGEDVFEILKDNNVSFLYPKRTL